MSIRKQIAGLAAAGTAALVLGTAMLAQPAAAQETPRGPMPPSAHGYNGGHGGARAPRGPMPPRRGYLPPGPGGVREPRGPMPPDADPGPPYHKRYPRSGGIGYGRRPYQNGQGWHRGKGHGKAYGKRQGESQGDNGDRG